MDQAPGEKVSIIIPAYNEEERIADTVRGAAALPGVCEVVVVDDGSSDETSARAAGAGARVLRNSKNLGKGGSMERGLKESSGGIVVFLDADLGASSSEAAKLYAPVVSGACDLSIADFSGGTKRRGGFGIVMGTASRGLKWKTGREFNSPISGQRAMTRDAALALCPIRSGFGAEVGMTIRAHALGMRITEVPVSMTHKATGKTLKGFVHRGRQLLHIVRTILSEPAGNRA